MKPIEFPEQTTVWAENQPPYLPLPAYTILFTGRLWLRQLNFGKPLQPQKPFLETPFQVPFTNPSDITGMER